VAADEVYGADPALRAAIPSHGLGYVLAISANRRVPTAAGPIRVDHLPALLPRRAWSSIRPVAHAFLAVATADERDRSPAPDGLIMLTVNEFRRLFDALLLGTHRTLARLLHWST
jgi:hypothetical protein